MISQTGASISFFTSLIFIYGMIHYSHYILNGTFDTHIERGNAKFYICVLAICMFVCIMIGLYFCGVVVN